jgi:EAL domain-containing protein (putative c-di-GMP-specific phosphodiesterase class I)
MRSGLTENEFSLVFQPKITTTDNAVAGAEALVRWNSRTLGSVPPTEFIPIAEESGLILELGSWVLETVSRQLNDWRDQSIDCPSISVNITSHQLHQMRFAAQIKKLISRYRLDPSWLSLELTESTLVDDINSAVKIMQALRDVGIGIAIDDFGTGFSSLSYLQRLPIDTLKIDRSFVSRIPENRDDMKLIRSIISIGTELDLIVVAEGVETEQQLQFLQAVQCDQSQGSFYSKPLPALDFLEYLKSHASRRVTKR